MPEKNSPELIDSETDGLEKGDPGKDKLENDSLGKYHTRKDGLDNDDLRQNSILNKIMEKVAQEKRALKEIIQYTLTEILLIPVRQSIWRI